MLNRIRISLFIAMAGLLAGLCSSCALPGSSTESEMPWNTPQTWEGTPSMPGLDGQ